METIVDKARAVLFAILVHVICLALLIFGLVWTRAATPISLPGAVIEAELVGPVAAPKPRAAAKPKPAPPKPEPPAPKPPEPKPEPPAQPQRNDAVEREKVADIAEQAEKAARAQEERHRQEQVRLQDELEKQQAAERERVRQLEDIRRQREAAEKRRKLEQEKLAQLNDLQHQPAKPARPAPPEAAEAEQARTGMAGQDNSLAAEYFAAIQNAVTQNWLRPDNAPAGLHCMLRIVQIPGGDVLSVQIINPCNADAPTRTSIEQAVKRAAPLPYQGYQKVFQREINFNFTYDG
jgi:colicin import membrane protein